MQHYLEHIMNKHEAEVFSSTLKDNITRLDKQSASSNFPLLLRLEPKLSADQYYACLGCMRCCKKRNSTLRHLTTCFDAHKKKSKELYDKYCPSEMKEQTASTVVVQQVVQGWTDEQVNALLGSMMACIHTLELDCYENSEKIRHYEDAVKDLPEDVQEELEATLDTVDTNDCSTKEASDVTQLYNLSAKLGFHLDDTAIKEAYQKWNKMPPKKLKKV